MSLSDDVINGLLTLLGVIVATIIANYYQNKKIKADISAVYAKLGLEQDGIAANNAKTWVEVAQRAADEYRRVMVENNELRMKIAEQDKVIETLGERIKKLENRKRRHE